MNDKDKELDALIEGAESVLTEESQDNAKSEVLEEFKTEMGYHEKRLQEAVISASTLIGFRLIKGGEIATPDGEIRADRVGVVPDYSKDMQKMFELYVPKFSSFQLERLRESAWKVTFGSPNQVFNLIEKTPHDALIYAAAHLANVTGLTREIDRSKLGG